MSRRAAKTGVSTCRTVPPGSQRPVAELRQCLGPAHDGACASRPRPESGTRATAGLLVLLLLAPLIPAVACSSASGPRGCEVDFAQCEISCETPDFKLSGKPGPTVAFGVCLGAECAASSVVADGFEVWNLSGDNLVFESLSYEFSKGDEAPCHSVALAPGVLEILVFDSVNRGTKPATLPLTLNPGEHATVHHAAISDAEPLATCFGAVAGLSCQQGESFFAANVLQLRLGGSLVTARTRRAWGSCVETEGKCRSEIIPWEVLDATPDGGLDEGHALLQDGRPVSFEACTPSCVANWGGTWVALPGGQFEMGCSLGDEDCGEDEKPPHQVTVSPFLMLETEVAQQQFFLATGRSGTPPCATCPLDNVPYLGALEFCALVGARLPTEAEWEYAARAGSSTRYSCGDSVACLGSIAWYEANSGDLPHPVKTLEPNAFGLYDMLGNVWEWTNDWYSSSYYLESPSLNPQGPDVGTERVARGGSSNQAPQNLRVSCRAALEPDQGTGGSPTGIRCVWP
jgi:formylglycine-generating enzyme required for sulfatase activity